MAVINFILSYLLIFLSKKVGYSGCNHIELLINIQLLNGLVTSKGIAVWWIL